MPGISIVQGFFARKVQVKRGDREEKEGAFSGEFYFCLRVSGAAFFIIPDKHLVNISK